jgi:hypothetical protein
VKGNRSGSGDQPFLFQWQRALRDSGLPPGTRGVALMLSTWMNPDGTNAYPGAGLLADAVGINVRNTRIHLARLEAAGWLGVAERGNGRGRATEYNAVIPERETSERKGVASDTVSGGKGCRSRPERVSLATIKGVASDTPPPNTTHYQPNEERVISELDSESETSGDAFDPERDEASATKEMGDDIAGFFDVVREHVGIKLEPSRALVDAVRFRMAKGYSARHVGGEVDARTWPAELESPEAMAIHRLRKLGGAA